ncbi:histidine phosphatase family protein [Kibdelosporangium philippinense]|uniref:Histidine phosphatase family protein n=1 Tax=Kibdelosporangium philippinense TaxID=211113 RepID=A0ABS8Z8Q3_9PSEU|nr:histidine phosphatase family protein [Kibdelosporangium philippinense]MCE7003787.1 histidine phosphatase family protein [Kibdelosporangium philippinense]
MGSRYLFLTRHGEALPDQTALTGIGCRQSVQLGRRLKQVPFDAIYHGPHAKAEQTAKLIAAEIGNVPLHSVAAAGDYIPYVPTREELPDAALSSFLSQFNILERQRGAKLVRQAMEQFTGPTADDKDRYELLVTYNYLAGWLVNQAQGSPRWRWLTLDHANAALTIIRYSPERAPTLLVFNDMGHLPADLRWTGFPGEFQLLA